MADSAVRDGGECSGAGMNKALRVMQHRAERAERLLEAHEGLFLSLTSKLNAIRAYCSTHMECTSQCNGGEDGPCDCEGICPRDVVDEMLVHVANYMRQRPDISVNIPEKDAQEREDGENDHRAGLAAGGNDTGSSEAETASDYEALRVNYEAALDAVVEMTGYLKNAFENADRANRGRERWAVRKLWDIISDGSDDPAPWDDLSTAAVWIRERLAATPLTTEVSSSPAASSAPKK